MEGAEICELLPKYGRSGVLKQENANIFLSYNRLEIVYPLQVVEQAETAAVFERFLDKAFKILLT